MRTPEHIEEKVPLIGICRHRLLTDGEGVSTLVAFHGCPLQCRYCLNPHSLEHEEQSEWIDCATLYERTRIDELYFLATGGGVTFGGGEPCLRSDFITRFRERCGGDWLITVESSLNVPQKHIEELLPTVNRFIIDIKEMNPDIYRRYTGRGNEQVVSNLRLLQRQGRADDCILRLPLIPGYNTEEDRRQSIEQLKAEGFSRFDLFQYIVPSTPLKP